MAEASNAGQEISFGKNTGLDVRPFPPASGAGDGGLQETKGRVGALCFGPKPPHQLPNFFLFLMV